MAAALAKDLRVRVMVDVDAGMSAKRAALKYQVSARTIYHWKALRHETGTLEPRTGKTGPRPKLADYRERILAAVREDSAITLNDLQAKLSLPVCLSTIWLTLKTWGIGLKKSPPGGRTAATGRRATASLVGHSDAASPAGALRVYR
jgi:transposase